MKIMNMGYDAWKPEKLVLRATFADGTWEEADYKCGQGVNCEIDRDDSRQPLLTLYRKN